MFLLAVAFGASWPVVGQVAKSRSVAEGAVGFGFPLAGFSGVAGALASSRITPRLGDARMLTLGSLGFAASIVVQAEPSINFAVAA
jgi:hypothetical protein